jgi:FkbM family methyltransferase
MFMLLFKGYTITILHIMNISTFRTHLGIFSVLNTDAAFYSELSRGQPWDVDMISKVLQHIPQTGNILDIGAHIGTHTVSYALNRPNCHIYSFEPQMRMRQLLEKNVNDNNLNNVTVYPFGIGHMEKTTYLNNDFISDCYPPELKVDYESNISVNFGGLGITTNDEGEKINIKTIDSMNFENVKYMKIDVEGAETLVLYGARNTIIKFKPILLVEQSNKSVFDLFKNDIDDLKDFDITTFLSSLGYNKIKVGNCDYLYIPS